MKSRSKEFIFYNKEKLSIKKEDAFQLLSSEEKQKELQKKIRLEEYAHALFLQFYVLAPLRMEFLANRMETFGFIFS